MVNNEINELYPGTLRLWRIGYIVLSAAIVSIFIAMTVLLEITRQIALIIDWGYASPFCFSVLILFLIQGFLVGMWLSIQIIFGCTHPIHKPHYWRWILLGIYIVGFMTITIFQFAIMWGFFRVPPIYFDLLGFLIYLIMVSINNVIMAFLFAAMSAVMWFKWLKPLTK
ncbi:MAG: hypothetical protein ACFFDJ_02045 [Candidatus Odinarchaeota archaeon]